MMESPNSRRGKGHLLSSFVDNMVGVAPVTLEWAIVVETTKLWSSVRGNSASGSKQLRVERTFTQHL
ncbi:hypothetical protein PAXRUDRAFT_586691 [Paxillus rubicundulus Ve08.2h10]|uniref:Uncharacterized protein n=1 Tax=Paxillus rubicundulus Ve08.2h10 TaxID=930991 RepID=A0A0D0CRX5_9AGAM|nr:hypothetical protein PAXRUDRAFT_586691 [Paxillus rubicundulus Ve08.2h10]